MNLTAQETVEQIVEATNYWKCTKDALMLFGSDMEIWAFKKFVNEKGDKLNDLIQKISAR